MKWTTASTALALGAVLALLGTGCSAASVQTIVLGPSARGRLHEGIGHSAPRYLDGAREGVQLMEIHPESLAEIMGLQPGDIIVEMVGVPCEDLPSCRVGAARLNAALYRRRPFVLTLQRRGIRVRIKYRSSEPRRLHP